MTDSNANSSKINNLQTKVDNIVNQTVTVDKALNTTSLNAIANKPVAEKFNVVDTNIANTDKKATDAGTKADQAIQKATDATNKAEEATKKAEDTIQKVSDLHVIMSEDEWNALSDADRDPAKIYLLYS